MGDQSLSRPLLAVIRGSLDIRDVRDRLMAGQAEVRGALATVLERSASYAL